MLWAAGCKTGRLFLFLSFLRKQESSDLFKIDGETMITESLDISFTNHFFKELHVLGFFRSVSITAFLIYCAVRPPLAIRTGGAIDYLPLCKGETFKAPLPPRLQRADLPLLRGGKIKNLFNTENHSYWKDVASLCVPFSFCALVTIFCFDFHLFHFLHLRFYSIH